MKATHGLYTPLNVDFMQQRLVVTKIPQCEFTTGNEISRPRDYYTEPIVWRTFVETAEASFMWLIPVRHLFEAYNIIVVCGGVFISSWCRSLFLVFRHRLRNVFMFCL